MADTSFKKNGFGSRIPHYEVVRFTRDVLADGVKKGTQGTVVGSNGSPVDSYEVDVPGKDFPITVHASEIELIPPARAKLPSTDNPVSIMPPVHNFKKNSL